MLKKGQAAMEYLMTYGWAILIVIVVVAALFAMGVFTVKPSVSCSPCFTNFAYIDYSAGTLKIRNGPQAIESIAVTSPAGVTVSPTTAGASEIITLTGISTTGDVAITLSYTVTASGLAHTDTATIHN